MCDENEGEVVDPDADTDPAWLDELLLRVAHAPAEQQALRLPHRIGTIQLERVIGEGGMGTVYSGTDLRHGREVAVKISRHVVAGPSRSRILAEAHALTRLRHPNIVSLFSVEEAEDRLLIVMERVAGGTLQDLLGMPAGTRRARATSRVARELFAAVAAAHALGIVHRDIKPGNILLTDTGQVKLGDFGVARIPPEIRPPGIGTTGLTGDAVVGTPRYMAPEQSRWGIADRSADVFSTCMVLTELALGRRFEWHDEAVRGTVLPGEVRRELEGLAGPELNGLASLLIRGTQARASDRPESAMELREAFARAALE